MLERGTLLSQMVLHRRGFGSFKMKMVWSVLYMLCCKLGRRAEACPVCGTRDIEEIFGASY